MLHSTRAANALPSECASQDGTLSKDSAEILPQNRVEQDVKSATKDGKIKGRYLAAHAKKTVKKGMSWAFYNVQCTSTT